MLYVSQPSDATKNVAQSINYKIKLKQSEFKWYAKKILGFVRFVSKIRDVEKNGLLTVLNSIVTPDSGSTMLFNIFNRLEQCWQQSIVQYCFHQLGTTDLISAWNKLSIMAHFLVILP